MRIGLVVQPLERTPPIRYGAVERIVAYLADTLVERGHDVTLFASGDSQTRARLVPCTERALLHDPGHTGESWWVNNTQMAQVVAAQDEFDVINSHAGYAFLPATLALRTPVVTTWHGRMHLPVTHRMLEYYRHTAFISIARHQVDAAGPGVRWAGHVPNGIPGDAVTYREHKRDFLLFLGRITPAKRPDVAIRAARRGGLPIRLAGRVAPADQDYFRTVVQPLLGSEAEYLGEITDAEKLDLLADARGLMHPSDWEACSVSLIEAHAAGTPCLALDRGGNAEIVRHEVTGFVGDGEEDLVRGCRSLDRIAPASCRARYEEEFSADRMTDRALAALESEILAGVRR
nr:glycosyltransferase family 4 protein [Dactylosporangium thailandense]